MNSAFFQKREGDFLFVTDEEEFRHLVKARRVRVGEKVRLLNGNGDEYLCEVKELDARSKRVKAVILKTVLKKRELPFKLTVAFSPLGEDRANEYLIEKCTEVGVSAFLPVFFERSTRKRIRRERWLRIAREAVKQSGRSVVPDIYEPVELQSIRKFDGSYRFFGQIDSGITLSWDKIDGSVIILIGPEGGITEDEITFLTDEGFTGVRLCSTILRAETAAVLFAGLVVHRMGGA